jgi:hypothetical protein
MAHHLDYMQLTWYVSLGLGTFRILSQFAIKMIAIFGSDKFSARAFGVLRISWVEQAVSTFRSRADNRPVARNPDIDEMPGTARHHSGQGQRAPESDGPRIAKPAAPAPDQVASPGGPLPRARSCRAAWADLCPVVPPSPRGRTHFTGVHDPHSATHARTQRR